MVTQNSAGRAIKTAAESEQRRSERIRYAFGLTVNGVDSAGYPFESQAYTEVATRDGGLLVCAESLKPRSSILLSRPNHQANAKIVAQVGLRDEHYLYGFHFEDPTVQDFWDIKFPPVQGIECSRVVLQCARCSRQEVVSLGEVDLLVLEQTLTAPHQCETCHQETLWQKPTLVGDVGVVTGSESYQASMAAFQRRARNVNDRKHPRIAMKNIVACLQREGLSDDVVEVLDMSRGGIRFMSLVDYQPGTTVQVAVPYTKGGANVFLSARVVRVKCRPTVDIPGEFGLSYEKR